MSGSFEVRFDKGNTFAAAMKRAPAIVQDELITSTNRITVQGEGFAKEKLTANGSVVTGHLRRSIAFRGAKAGGGGVTGSYGTSTKYAQWVEEGRGAVVPVNAKVLAFTVKGKKVFTKRAGPARARPFMKPTVAKIRPLARQEYRAALKRAAQRIGLS